MQNNQELLPNMIIISVNYPAYLQCIMYLYNYYWTELNKERAKRLIQNGKMTEAGLKVLPDLSPNSFQIPKDILEALQNDVQTWNNFQRFPDVYKRIRIGYIEEVRKQPSVFQKRLANFLKKTHENKMFGTIE